MSNVAPEPAIRKGDPVLHFCSEIVVDAVTSHCLSVQREDELHRNPRVFPLLWELSSIDPQRTTLRTFVHSISDPPPYVEATRKVVGDICAGAVVDAISHHCRHAAQSEQLSEIASGFAAGTYPVLTAVAQLLYPSRPAHASPRILRPLSESQRLLAALRVHRSRRIIADALAACARSGKHVPDILRRPLMQLLEVTRLPIVRSPSPERSSVLTRVQWGTPTM